jgi:hypothetical protein
MWCGYTYDIVYLGDILGITWGSVGMTQGLGLKAARSAGLGVMCASKNNLANTCKPSLRASAILLGNNSHTVAREAQIGSPRCNFALC